MRNSILTIDDEIHSTYIAEYVRLSMDLTIEVDLAHTIKDAIELISNKYYNVILCDLLMPPETFHINQEEFVFNEEDCFNGRKIIEYCIEKGITKKTKVIVSSVARKYSQVLVESYNHEIEMISKPYPIEELIGKIKETH
ncbi:MAG: hypothetical protein GC192_24745 [Bacteroidetes bacterium]|nr:hypothetical protein [Bacteroidota bacterium]